MVMLMQTAGGSKNHNFRFVEHNLFKSEYKLINTPPRPQQCVFEHFCLFAQVFFRFGTYSHRACSVFKRDWGRFPQQADYLYNNRRPVCRFV